MNIPATFQSRPTATDKREVTFPQLPCPMRHCRARSVNGISQGLRSRPGCWLAACPAPLPATEALDVDMPLQVSGPSRLPCFSRNESRGSSSTPANLDVPAQCDQH